MDAMKVLVIFSALIFSCQSSKVLELSDRFLELRGESTWMIMFYAPWCGHCKKLEPVWSHVAQALYGTDIRVGRVDCTRFTAMASEFVVKGYPTIMFIQGDTRHTYRGDRTRDDIVGYALRMANPPVQPLSTYHHLKDTINQGHLFFLYAGMKEGQLWESFKSLADDERPHNFFYSIDASCMSEFTDLETNPAILVFKDDTHYYFPVPADEEIANDISPLNETLADWIVHERFPLFSKITHGNMQHLWKMRKVLIMAVVEEHRVGVITTDESEFKDMVESVIRTNRDKYHEHFQFGWTGSPDIANSIAMERLPLPSLLAVNTSNMYHYLPEDPAHHLTPAVIEIFLDSIIGGSAPSYGGDSYPMRAYRVFYNGKTSLEDMWHGNPVLTAVLFGLPLGFLSLICYSIWCSDIMDADEDEDEHEKKE
ncbi:protein disulfide-isomerase TMX3-like isoform X2 [Oratosquilla oratoria]|uniref:protein disulfide-isomerase TMX3-like isoform X2 n=1 Tax=Oratosquilla oratoria TaxID=337810 RepID=UPI003F762EE5